MRQKTKKLNELLEEYKALKKIIFPDGALFVMHDDTAKQKRFDQLQALFYPALRWPTWKNPLND